MILRLKIILENIRKKILNRAKIIEQNYKRFNQYQNTRYNIIDKCNYDSFSSLNRKNNNGLIIKTPTKKIYYLDTNNSRLGRKLNNSVSSKNNLKINFYLSDFSNEKIYNNKEYMGKKRTDITNNDYINITDNNDNGFYDYCQKKIEILLNNKKMVEDKEKQKKINKYNMSEQEKNEMDIKNKYFNNLNLQNKLNIKYSQMEYKNLLDEQNKNNINNKLINENLTLGDIIQNQLFLSKKK